MKKAIGVLVFLALGLFASIASATVYDNIVHQAYYALDPSASGTSSQTISGDYAGDWNWLTSNGNYRNLSSSYYNSPYCFASDWAFTNDSSGCPHLAGLSSFYQDPNGYGYAPSAIPLAMHGRSGQCVYFVNLVLYRAGLTNIISLNIATMNGQSLPLSYAQPGYVLQRYDASVKHVAIIVGVTRDGNGNVTAVTVVDSNWVSDYGPNMEIIAKHTIWNPDPSLWKVWHYGF